MQCTGTKRSHAQEEKTGLLSGQELAILEETILLQ